jgi:hypothetical protein
MEMASLLQNGQGNHNGFNSFLIFFYLDIQLFMSVWFNLRLWFNLGLASSGLECGISKETQILLVSDRICHTFIHLMRLISKTER